jgi:glucose/arabinose dehydrogenase
LTFPSSVTTGDLIIVAITQFEGSVSSVRDHQSNTYTQVTAAQHANTSYNYAQLYYAKNVTGGTTTVTVTFSISADNVGIYEYSGLDTTSPLDQVVSNVGVANTPNGGTLNTTKDNELYFAVGVDDNGNNSSPSAGSGYTLEDHQDDTLHHERFYSEDRISAHGSYQTNFSIAAPSDWAVIGASFKPAGTPTYASPTLGPGVVYLEEVWSNRPVGAV